MGLDGAIPSVMRKQTEAMIHYRPESVVLTRTTLVADGSGGFTQTGPTPLVPQLMRLIPTRSITEQAPIRVTADGQTVSPNWYLLCEWDADVEIRDTATVRGHKLEVVYVSNLPDERIVAECWENI